MGWIQKLLGKHALHRFGMLQPENSTSWMPPLKSTISGFLLEIVWKHCLGIGKPNTVSGLMTNIGSVLNGVKMTPPM